MKRKLLRGTGYTLATLVALVAVAAGAVYVLSARGLARHHAVDEGRLMATFAPADSATVARGAHIAAIRGCNDCHAADYGGKVFIDDPALGFVTSSNLTPGAGGTADWTPQDWDRAIRHGLKRDGTPLLVMPSFEYHGISDEDVGALVAYFRSLPPVDREAAPDRIGPLGRALYVTGAAPLVPADLIDHAAERAPAPPAGPTAAYGAYLATSCQGCHGHDFGGGPLPGAPPTAPLAANLTPDPETGLGTWTEADFARALREGVRPDGSRLAPEMPTAMTAQLTDTEIQALWAYFQSRPALHRPKDA